ncbi:MAG: hypothetical protein K2N55_04000, partial [Lachnospiraceae bacterium]|nr:hypothetical protein [Lachnospiraceae bacterium]
ENLTFIDGLDANVVAYLIENSPNQEIAEDVFIIYNANKDKVSVPLPEGEWEIYINGEKAGCEVIGTASGSVTVEGISAMALTRGISEHAKQIGTTSQADGKGNGESGFSAGNLLLCLGGICLAVAGVFGYKKAGKNKE